MNSEKKQKTACPSGIDRLEALIQKATSPYHTVRAAENCLTDAGFEPLGDAAAWALVPGKKYVATPYDSCLIAFSVGADAQAHDGFRIGAAHGDFPGFRIKPRPQMEKDGYLRLNAEGYGSANHMSWLDRPLSLAGRIALRSEDPFAPRMRLVDFQKPLLTIPNVAVHLQRDMNKGMELKKQTQMLPLIGLSGEEASENLLVRLLAEQLSCEPEDILDYELNLYSAEAGGPVGVNDAFYQAPRLDDLTSVQALLDALTTADRTRGINVLVVFDHEEVGSRTKQGAAGTLLTRILEKLYRSLGWSEGEYADALRASLMMSVDVAHALHPAYENHYDPVNKNIMGKGFSIKQACSQSYASDSETVAIVQQICDAKRIPYQKFVNHSDERGGGTLGSIAAALLPVRCADIGVPILSMHSARETMGTADQKALTDYLTAFYSL